MSLIDRVIVWEFFFMAECYIAAQLVDEGSISMLWTRKGNFIEWIKSGFSVSVALRRQHR